MKQTKMELNETMMEAVKGGIIRYTVKGKNKKTHIFENQEDFEKWLSKSGKKELNKDQIAILKQQGFMSALS